MAALPPTADMARAASLTARLGNRLARHVPFRPVRFAPPTPMVSFTFDDAPACAGTTGAAVLADHGARATYYVASGLIGTHGTYWRNMGPEDLVRLHEAGHEIGAHTHTHAFLPDLRADALAQEIRCSGTALRAILPGLQPESFAYPYGFATPRAKEVLAWTYRSCRGIAPGLNRGFGDRSLLRANPLIDRCTDAAAVVRLMDEAQARGGWLIFYGHDVVRNPSPYGCSPDLLGAALRAASARGLACVTVAEGLRRSLPRTARRWQEAALDPAGALAVWGAGTWPGLM